MKNSCSRTILGCYVGYIVQAIVNNFVPLLFVMFERTYQIPLSKITLLITINFCIQLGIDLLSAWFLDRIGYRAAILLSHIASAAGLVLLTILPDMLPDAFTGLLIAVVIYAVGGGLLEVIVSPVMESCPTQNKEQHMSLLHSFYCWGHMGVVLLSTAFFALFGIGNWKLLALLWALVPVGNAVFFGGAPLFCRLLMLCRPVFLHWLFSPFPRCFFLSISASSFIKAAFKICAVIFPPLMHSEMVFSLTSSCTVAHLPSIAALSGADCPSHGWRGIAQHRAKLLTALVQQIAALPFVPAMLAGMAAVRSRTLAHHTFKGTIRKIHRHQPPISCLPCRPTQIHAEPVRNNSCPRSQAHYRVLPAGTA